MKIVFTNKNGAMRIKLSGRLDSVTAPKLDEFLNEKLSGVSSLVFDLSELEYISSAGLRVLLSAQKRMMNSMKLTGVGAAVMEVLEMTGFADILVIE